MLAVAVVTQSMQGRAEVAGHALPRIRLRLLGSPGVFCFGKVGTLVRPAPAGKPPSQMQILLKDRGFSHLKTPLALPSPHGQTPLLWVCYPNMRDDRPYQRCHAVNIIGSAGSLSVRTRVNLDAQL